MDKLEKRESLEGIAIIGMAGRFPGAKNIDEFWENLRAGVESISFFSAEELEASGTDPAELSDPHYVRARGALEDVELFDASFFGFSAREAEITDPQHRLFLECAWEAVESAGYSPENFAGSIGVYAGAGGINTYFLNNLYSHRQLRDTVGDFQILIANDKDFLSTRVSYKLNLKGPSLTVQTACSTSLVAVTQACQSLLDYQCDMALAGGVSISVPQKTGYLYREGMILSPDGHCRAFDAKAQGTVPASGAGVVVLKRLEDAVADGDCIHAVIKGFAINNDGSFKAGYTAPSVGGQAEAIAQALALAEIDPETVTYIEAHGTGTPLGDPIEIAALTQAFRASTQKKGFCAIGSAKTNIGHLDAAAGVTGLIKTVLALKHKLLPPSLHFEAPNPKIDFANSPFYVNTALQTWKTNGFPRRAGVSSFGIGGTNAHVVLEEAPALERGSGGAGVRGRKCQLLVLSAKTSTALDTATANLAEHLKQHPELNLADVAHTLNIGRKAFSHRRFAVCQDIQDAVNALTAPESQRVFTNSGESKTAPVAFMFSGQGSQYVNMARELYEVESTFREQVDLCCELLKPHLGLDLRDLLYPGEGNVGAASERLKQTALAQPALFVIEYALAQLWVSWGVRPVAAIGHSIGEYVAACLAGVFSLEDALTLVAARGKMMQEMPPGAMLAVPLSEQEVRLLLQRQPGSPLQLGAINGPSNCVVSGPADAAEALQQTLLEQGVECRRLHTSHAFHSPMMEAIVAPFTERVRQVSLNAPKIPYISNVTGTWVTAAQATDPNYWGQHLRQTVLFSSGLQQLLKEPDWILLEIGPGRTLATLAKQQADKAAGRIALSSLRHPQDRQPDVAFLLNTLGRLWLAGVPVDWSGFYAGEQRHRLPLPTYPFERQRYWIEAEKPAARGGQLQLGEPQLWQSVLEAAQIQAQQGIAEFDSPSYQAKRQCLERLCAAYMNRALQDWGAFANRDEKYSLEEFFQKFRILPRYQQLWPRWLKLLAEQGELQQDGESFTNFIPLSKDAFNALAAEVRVRWADAPEWVDSVVTCGEKMIAIMTGEQDPMELFFPEGSLEVMESLVQNWPVLPYCNAIMRASLQQVVKLLPARANLRILEIGAGVGLTTADVLPVLPPEQTSYTFTDVGSLFLQEAKRKFSAYPFVEYRLLDIDRPPQEQGYEPHSFDVVIAANVLYFSRKISETLEYVRSLLAPQGLLLLWEITQPQLDFEICDGLVMSPLTDGERTQGNPFLSKEQWLEALREHGFVEVAALPETEAVAHHILLAQASAAAEVPAPTAFTSAKSENLQSQEKTNQSKLAHARPNLSHAFVAPRNPLEQTIAGVWQQSLGIEKVGVWDNFFELGGDSLLAVYLISQVSKATQTKLSTHSLLDAPTIAGLAELITANASAVRLPSSLVEIQKGSLKQPLFLVHPVGGQVYIYRDLAHYLGPDQPVYGFQADGADGETDWFARVEEMAAHYMEVLRGFQPEGPYFLGGHSFGGAVAFEMAQQLQALGEKVALLVLIDTRSPNRLRVEQLENDDVKIMAYSLGLDANLSAAEDSLRQLDTEAQLRYFLEQGKMALKIPPYFGLTDLRRYYNFLRVNLKSLRNYTPQAYPGRVIFFRALEPDELNPPNPELGWIDLVKGGLEIHEVPGNHTTMNFPPNVQVMAHRLRAYLDEARAVNGVL